MALKLGVDVQDLTSVAGAPWSAEDCRPDTEGSASGYSWLFVGHADQSVAIAMVEGSVVVGPAIGSWQGPGCFRWRVGEPCTVISEPATIRQPSLLLTRLRAAVIAAVAAKAPSLVRCQFCGNLVAPEHAFDPTSCHGCATIHLGIVY